jgi:TetR/AcrR family transcriptional regulator of autoinduction and epiphytic fitness
MKKIGGPTSKPTSARAAPPRPESPQRPETAHRTDGRTARGERTRKAIVEALLELLAEGDQRAAPERIVERAGVSLRTLWTNFKDLEHLYAEANAALIRRQDEAHRPIAPEAPLDNRVRAYGEQRARLLEIVAPAARASQLRIPFSAQLRRNQQAHIVRMRAELNTVFAAELDAAGADREQLMRSLLAATSWPVWSVLRYDLGLDLRASTKVITNTVGALLTLPA